MIERPAPLYGLVLAGGESRRMQADKALLDYHGKPQLVWTSELLGEFCERVFVSVREAQAAEPVRAGLPQIVDLEPGLGPAGGIHTAQCRFPDAAWLVVACDLPFLSAATLEYLLTRRAATCEATAYRSSHDGLPEPLCAVWEPASAARVRAALAQNQLCPRKMLTAADAVLIEQPEACALDNVNTRVEHEAAARRLNPRVHG